MDVLGGIFVGGAGSRFGGVAKGLLPSPDGLGSILDRLCRVMRSAGVEPVLVGQRAEYTSLGLPTIADRDAQGPLGGFLALYEHAGDRRVLALACDMPFVTSLAPLLSATAPLAAPKRNGTWEPFYSVHDPRIMAPIAKARAAANRLSLQALFDDATEITVDAHELDDWDTPADQAAGLTRPIRTMSK